MRLEDYETRMVHNGRRNNREVKIHCEFCGQEAWVKWQRVREGQGRFCSLSCYNKLQREEGKKTWGKENAVFCWNKEKKGWGVYWRDKETGQQKSTTKARWLWEQRHGNLSGKWVVIYIDGNSENCVLDNLKVISRSESNSIHMVGHKVSDATRKKISKAHSGKILSEEHKQKIGKATRRMWEEGLFDAPYIRETYAKQGRATKGSRRTEEQRKRMSEAGKKRAAIQFASPEAVEKRKQEALEKERAKKFKKKRKFTAQHLQRLSDAGRKREDIKGENCIFWQGGVENKVYPEEFTPYLKRKIRKRDNYECQCCGVNVYGSRFGHVHHKDGDKQNCGEDNLVLVCMACHNSIHGRSKPKNKKILAFRSMLNYTGENNGN